MLIECTFRPVQEISGLKGIFRNHLIAISNNFYPEGTISTLSFTDDNGFYYGAIFKKDATTNSVCTCVVHIEDMAEISIINEFMKAVIANLGEVRPFVLFYDQSEHGEYTTGKITEQLNTHRIFDKWLSHEQYHATSRSEKEIVLKEGYEIRTCGSEYAKHVAMLHYAPQDEETLAGFTAMIEENLQYRPSYGVFGSSLDSPKYPIAWFTMYEDVSLGALHCMEDYRCMGFGRALVRHAMNVISKLNDDFTFIVNIVSSNEGSIKLFESEGYIKQAKNPGMIYINADIFRP